MSTRTFFQLLFKLFALILIVSSVNALAVSIQSIFYFFSNYDILLLGIGLVTLTFFIALIYVLLYKGDFIIDKLKLTSNIDEYLSFNIHRKDVLSIAVLLIGGYTLIDEIPAFFSNLYSYYWEARLEYGFGPKTSGHQFAYSSARIIIALLLLGNKKAIVNFIELKRKK